MSNHDNAAMYEAFLQLKPHLTKGLAEAVAYQLRSMGEDAKGVSWFSSIADTYKSKGDKA